MSENPNASPVCFQGSDGADAQQALDVARWRAAERVRLRAERMALSVDARQTWARALAGHLDALLPKVLGDVEGRVISGSWPIKGEADLRPWLSDLHARGAVVALPVVVERAAPLHFRRWVPGMALERGNWNIPVPPDAGEELVPDLSLAPLVGWDVAGYRLGYGGGYFDRTLASLSPQPVVIGVGLQAAEVKTIFPQVHDIAMSVIVTETGVQRQK